MLAARRTQPSQEYRRQASCRILHDTILRRGWAGRGRQAAGSARSFCLNCRATARAHHEQVHLRGLRWMSNLRRRDAFLRRNVEIAAVMALPSPIVALPSANFSHGNRYTFTTSVSHGGAEAKDGAVGCIPPDHSIDHGRRHAQRLDRPGGSDRDRGDAAAFAKGGGREGAEGKRLNTLGEDTAKLGKRARLARCRCRQNGRTDASGSETAIENVPCWCRRVPYGSRRPSIGLHRNGLQERSKGPPSARSQNHKRLQSRKSCTELQQSAPTRRVLARAKDEVRPAGFEPATLGSEDRCAIQLRHGRS